MNSLIQPERGFSVQEFEQRTENLQRKLHEQQIDAVFFSTEAEFRYFSGFKSQFWESPTRPWFLVVPANGLPIAVVPEIGVKGLQQTWLHDIRCWPSPRPEDDGISLLATTLAEISTRNQRVGAMLGPETHLRMPASNYLQLTEMLSTHHFVDVSEILLRQRSIKSPAEVEKIRFACEVTANGFEFLLSKLQAGTTERQACKLMQINMLQSGADSCPYLISGSGKGGYDNIIMGPSDRILLSGDILIIDTGANFDGYFSDFDRNFGFIDVEQQSLDAYEVLFQATENALRIAGPGRTTGDIWQAMWSVMKNNGAEAGNIGRMGHGLGMQLTEWPSNVESGDTVLESGMVLTLEPGLTINAEQMMVHEENILITENGCELLHARAWPELPIIDH